MDLTELIRAMDKLDKRISNLETSGTVPHWRGTKAGAMTTADLPFAGDYGVDTTNNRLYINYNGSAVKYASLT